MALSNRPVFAQTPKIALAASTAANTNLDGTGTIIQLGTVGSDGGLITSLTARHIASNSGAAGINFFVSLDDGETWKLWERVLLAAASSIAATSAPVVGTVIDSTNPDAARRLPANARVGFASMDSEGVIACMEWVDY